MMQLANKYALKGEPVYSYTALDAFGNSGRLSLSECGYYQTMPQYHFRCDDNEIYYDVSVQDVMRLLHSRESLHSFTIIGEHLQIICDTSGYIITKVYHNRYDQTPEFTIKHPYPQKERTEDGIAFLFAKYDLYGRYISLIFVQDYRHLGGMYLGLRQKRIHTWW